MFESDELTISESEMTDVFRLCSGRRRRKRRMSRRRRRKRGRKRKKRRRKRRTVPFFWSAQTSLTCSSSYYGDEIKPGRKNK